MSRTYLRQTPLMVGPKTNLGIKNLYKNPEEVGADRLVNAVAVRALYRKAAIVVDFGTATTFDCVSAQGEYLGGAICPGMELAGEWLATHTAKLPRVTFISAPSKAIGKTTKESLQSGLFWGYIGLVSGLLQRLTIEMKGRPVVIATGGLSTVIGPYLKPVPRILPNLTLEGLRLIWERNKRGHDETHKRFGHRLRVQSLGSSAYAAAPTSVVAQVNTQISADSLLVSQWMTNQSQSMWFL